MTVSAPQGIVTLVFTDIQSSTKLWERLGNDFHTLLESHNKIARAVFAEHRGYEVKTEGDAFMVAFAEPSDALAASIALQEALHNYAWPSLLPDDDPDAGVSADGAFRGLRVRIGIHCGEPICQPGSATGRMDYFGQMVNLSARIGEAGHGGQIVVSSEVKSSITGVALEILSSLGEHRLKGVETPQILWQATPASLKARAFPPLRTIDPTKTNLPRRLSSFVGRDAEIAELRELLTNPNVHLVALLGPAGTGKTRLSQRVGAEVLESFPAGVWFADATAATSHEGVCHALGQALHLPLTQADPLEQLGHALDGRTKGKGRMLVIFDNAEQVVEASAAAISTWLEMAPEVCFLVTSREALNIEGEHEHRLEPLPLPREGEGPFKRSDRSRHTAQLEAFASVKLFMDRARTANPKLHFDGDNLAAVAAICRHLEGIPLAIELAASRSKLLPPKKLLQKLEQDGNTAIRSQRRDLSARQATLDGAIAWSWDLLSEEEKAALSSLAFFRGGFFLELAEGLLGDDAEDLVASLLDKSLLKSWEVENLGETRFGMYRSIQDFARAKAEEIMDAAATLLRWAEVVTEYATEWCARLTSKDAKEALDRIGLEIDNLFAIQELLEVAQPELAALAILSAAIMLATRGPWKERIPRIQRALAGLGAESALVLRLRLTSALTQANYECGSKEDLQESARQCAALGQELVGDDDESEVLRMRVAISHALALRRIGSVVAAGQMLEQARERVGVDLGSGNLAWSGKSQQLLVVLAGVVGARGNLHGISGEYAQALPCFAEAEAINRALGNLPGVAANVGNSGLVHQTLGENQRALSCYTEAETINRELGSLSMIAGNVGNRGIVHHRLGEYEQALACYAEAEAIGRELGNRSAIATNLGNRGIVLRELGDFEGALAAYLEAEAIHRTLGNLLGAAICVGNRGDLLRELGKLDEAWVVIEESESLCRQTGGKFCLAYQTLSKAQILCTRDRDLDLALELAQESHDLRESMGVQKTREFFETLAMISQLHLKLEKKQEGHLAKAREYAQRAKVLGAELAISRTFEKGPKQGQVNEFWQWVDEALAAE